MHRDRDIIVEARNHILDTINRYYPNAIKVRTLLRAVLLIQPDYDLGLASKDLHYLAAKGYITIRQADRRLALGETFADRLVDITASGKEIADQIIDDPALEI